MRYRVVAVRGGARVANPPTTAEVRDMLMRRARELGWPVVRRVGGSEAAWWNFIFGDPLTRRVPYGARGRNVYRLLAELDGLSADSETTVSCLNIDASPQCGREDGAIKNRRLGTPATRTPLKRSVVHA